MWEEDEGEKDIELEYVRDGGEWGELKGGVDDVSGSLNMELCINKMV